MHRPGQFNPFPLYNTNLALSILEQSRRDDEERKRKEEEAKLIMLTGNVIWGVAITKGGFLDDSRLATFKSKDFDIVIEWLTIYYADPTNYKYDWAISFKGFGLDEWHSYVYGTDKAALKSFIERYTADRELKDNIDAA